MRTIALCIGCIACESPHPPFALREPFVVDTDLHPMSVPCRIDPTSKEAHHWDCAPREYVSPFVWDQVDNLWFAPLSRTLSVEVSGEPSGEVSCRVSSDA